MAKKLLDFDHTSRTEDLLADMQGDTFKGVDSTFDIDINILLAMQGNAGYELCKAEVLLMLPSPLHSQVKTSQGVITELDAWLDRPATKWLAPALLREVGVLKECLGMIKQGSSEVTNKMQTPFLKACSQKIAYMTRASSKVKKGQKVETIDLTGEDAAKQLLVDISVKCEKKAATQTDLDEFDQHLWLLPKESLVEWKKVEVAITEFLGTGAKRLRTTAPRSSGGSNSSSSSTGKQTSGAAASSKGGLKAAAAEVWASFG